MPAMSSPAASAAVTPSSTPEVLFPPIEPFDSFMLDVGDGHRLHVEQCGHREGAPVIVLHGGPASGTSPLQRRFFDPAVHRVVLFDQRGSGRSTPAGEIAANTTGHLIDDIEAIRRRLGIERWLVFGGSWGASLGIAYAAAHPARCRGLLLRGMFLTDDADLDWFFGSAGALLPQAWEALAAAAGLDAMPERAGVGLALMDELLRRILDGDGLVAASAAAVAWGRWEEALSGAWRGLGPQAGRGTNGAAATGDAPPPSPPPAAADPLNKYRVQAHYLRHRCWLGAAELLRMAGTLGTVPAHILHGRLDWICRPGNAVALQRALPGSQLEWVDATGHSPFDPPMAEAIVQAVGELHASADA